MRNVCATAGAHRVISNSVYLCHQISTHNTTQLGVGTPVEVYIIHVRLKASNSNKIKQLNLDVYINFVNLLTKIIFHYSVPYNMWQFLYTDENVGFETSLFYQSYLIRMLGRHKIFDISWWWLRTIVIRRWLNGISYEMAMPQIKSGGSKKGLLLWQYQWWI